MGSPSVFLGGTLAYCPVCRVVEHARLVARPDGVFMERMCPKGISSVRVLASHDWYMDRLSNPQKIAGGGVRRPSAKGCPLDCGPCSMHKGGLHLPVFSITNDCNLDCPKCFTYNRPDRKYYKSVADTRKIIGHIVKDTGGVQLINLTGGEPTLHPKLKEILNACRHPKIGRITMNTNGLLIGRDEKLARMLKTAGVQVILSLDTLRPAVSRKIAGRDITADKKRALKMLEKLDIPTTVLFTCIKGVNEDEVAKLAAEYVVKPFVRSVTVQNMTYTGKNGSLFQPRLHITIDEVEDLLSSTGVFSKADFFPLGSYHPLCYSVAYYIIYRGHLLPVAKLVEKGLLTEATSGSYLLSPDRDIARHFLDGINTLWAEGADEKFIDFLREKARAAAGGRAVIPDEYIRAVYIHPHMDEDNFDLDRVSRCGDLVPDEDGNMVPACSYNLLYRQQDERFWVERSSPEQTRG